MLIILFLRFFASFLFLAFCAWRYHVLFDSLTVYLLKEMRIVIEIVSICCEFCFVFFACCFLDFFADELLLSFM